MDVEVTWLDGARITYPDVKAAVADGVLRLDHGDGAWGVPLANVRQWCEMAKASTEPQQ
jgi:hypothetical protein